MKAKMITLENKLTKLILKNISITINCIILMVVIISCGQRNLSNKKDKSINQNMSPIDSFYNNENGIKEYNYKLSDTTGFTIAIKNDVIIKFAPTDTGFYFDIGYKNIRRYINLHY